MSGPFDEQGRPVGAVRRELQLAGQREGGRDPDRAAGGQVRAHERLRKEVERFRGLLETAPNAIVIVDERGEIVLVNGEAERMFGYAREELVGRAVEILLPEDFRGQHATQRDRFTEQSRTRRMGIGMDLVARRKDGTRFEVEIGLGRLESDEGLLISSVISDISERKLAEEAGAHLAAIVESSNDAIVGKTLEGTITSWNPAAERMYGYAAEEAIGRHISMLCPSAEQLHELAEILRRVAAGSRVDHFETSRLCKDGRVIDVSVTVSPIRDRHGQVRGASTVARDITERKRYEDRLQHLVDHDPLTGLLNRHSFSQALDSHAALVSRYGAEGALLMLDLDHFKYVNDTLGHQAGDEIIAQAAELLAGRLRESDILARLGGDEFAALLPKADAHDAERVALELLQVFTEQPIPVIGAGARAITASIGVATFEPQLSGEDVLVNADLAMYDAKDAGRNRIALYSAGEHDQALMKGRLSWVSRIRTALAEDRFSLLAQPIIDYSTGRVSQHELLLRMIDEDGRLIAPGAFLDIAERLDLVQQIDAWVIKTAIGLLAERDTAGDPLPLSINLSGRSLGEPKLLELIEHELERTGAAPDRLTFEITETAAIRHITDARRFSERLAQLGCRLALDDFGAGFGSFYYLKHLPFDFLKIDGEFVRNCTNSKTDQLVIEAVVGIARGLGKTSVAEHVGDDDTVRLLIRLGVDYGQGYHHGHPAPLNTPR